MVKILRGRQMRPREASVLLGRIKPRERTCAARVGTHRAICRNKELQGVSYFFDPLIRSRSSFSTRADAVCIFGLQNTGYLLFW